MIIGRTRNIEEPSPKTNKDMGTDKGTGLDTEVNVEDETSWGVIIDKVDLRTKGLKV